MTKQIIEPPRFRAKITATNMITVPKHIRMLFSIQPKQEIVLEMKGKISKTEKYLKINNNKSEDCKK